MAIFIISIFSFYRLPLVSFHSRSRREVNVNGKKIDFWNDKNVRLVFHKSHSFFVSFSTKFLESMFNFICSSCYARNIMRWTYPLVRRRKILLWILIRALPTSGCHRRMELVHTCAVSDVDCKLFMQLNWNVFLIFFLQFPRIYQ